MKAKEEDPYHPIIDRPWDYEIVLLGWSRETETDPSFLDLTLRKGTVLRRLRFAEPQEIEIEKGFSVKTGGLYIADVKHRGLDGITVRVSDFEASPGAIRFWARDVIDLDAQK